MGFYWLGLAVDLGHAHQRLSNPESNVVERRGPGFVILKKAVALDCDISTYNDDNAHWMTRFTAVVFVIGLFGGFYVLGELAS